MADKYVFIRILHGGSFVNSEKPKYLNGKVWQTAPKYMDVDFLSMLEFSHIVKQELGYKKEFRLYHRQLLVGVECFKLVITDKDVMDITNAHKDGDTIEFVVEHAVDEDVSDPAGNVSEGGVAVEGEVNVSEVGVAIEGEVNMSESGNEVGVAVEGEVNVNEVGVAIEGEVNVNEVGVAIEGEVNMSESENEVGVAVEGEVNVSEVGVAIEGEVNISESENESESECETGANVVTTREGGETTSNQQKEKGIEVSEETSSDDEDEEYAEEKDEESDEDFDLVLEGSDVEDDDVSTARENVRQYRETRRREKRGENLNVGETNLGEAGVDVGFEGGGEHWSSKGLTGNDELYDSSDPEDLCDSDEDGEACDGKRNRGRAFDPDCVVPSWELGMIFSNVQQFREAVARYAIAKGVCLKLRPNDKHRVRVKCVRYGCPWLLFAGIENRTQNFLIKTYNPVHKCFKSNKNKLCDSSFIARHFERRILSQPSIKLLEIQRLCKDELKVYVGRSTCRRAKQKVLKVLVGDSSMEFAKLHDYCDEIRRSNPGTTCFAMGSRKEDGTQEFRKFYVCFDAIKRGFKEGIRHVIGMDACFLKGPCHGQLVVACSKDGNNQMFPIAWAIVGVENKRNWMWFINTLMKDL